MEKSGLTVRNILEFGIFGIEGQEIDIHRLNVCDRQGVRSTNQVEERETSRLTLRLCFTTHIFQNLEPSLISLASNNLSLASQHGSSHSSLVSRCSSSIQHFQQVLLSFLVAVEIGRFLHRCIFEVGEDGGEKNPCGHTGSFVLCYQSSILIG